MRKEMIVVAALLVLSGCMAIPRKDNPSAYTLAFVQDAIRYYDREGRQAMIDRYSSPDSLDGQWYLFVISEENRIIAHYDPARMGADNLLFADSTGYQVGKVVAETTEQGQWLTYFALNPETGQDARKHAWVIRHDGIIFGAGWYE
ncbi:MAG: hypothetical protein OXO48_10940 [Caldilineaceae bacterium]|nr:hypothetical protein [Caldilineaceae bacterium]